MCDLRWHGRGTGLRFDAQGHWSRAATLENVAMLLVDFIGAVVGLLGVAIVFLIMVIDDIEG